MTTGTSIACSLRSATPEMRDALGARSGATRQCRGRSRMNIRGCLPTALLALAALAQAAEPPAVSFAAPAAVAVADAPLPIDAAAPIAASSADRVLVAGRQRLRYRASWSELVLSDAAGVPQATISGTSYVRTGLRDAAARPLVFAFNGGPGASSSPLHFSLLGPRVFMPGVAGGPRELADNASTILDAADLVLVDPVGTGFSRELRPGGGRAYWSPSGDAHAVLAFVRDWVKQHGRERSPLYFIGESYGGYRLAEMARDLGGLPVAGLVFISPALDRSAFAVGNDQSQIFNLPTMAVTAWKHGRVPADGRSVEDVWEQARAFAQADYAAALQLGSDLPVADRERIAQRMAQLVGLPAAVIVAANLRLDTQDFLEQLLPGRIVGRLDTRVSAPRPDGPLVAGRSKAADDPVLNMGASNVKRSPAIRDYLRDAVGVRTAADYVSLTLDVNFAWDWSAGAQKAADGPNLSPLPNVVKLMRDRPPLRLLLLGGYFDLATPALAQRYALTHVDLPRDRTSLRFFDAGHTPYETPEDRAAVSAVLRDFIR
jgi:carboxypeptidase C (cathepsin A)